MKLNKKGETYDYGNRTFAIGEDVIANEQDDIYTGLRGYITEIRDGEDMETENPEPEIEVNFYSPEKSEEEEFAKRLDKISGIENFGYSFDSVIMAPDFLICEHEYRGRADEVQFAKDTLKTGRGHCE